MCLTDMINGILRMNTSTKSNPLPLSYLNRERAHILSPISHMRLMTRSMINAETGRRGDAEKIKIFSNIFKNDEEVIIFILRFSLINYSPLRLPVSLSLRFISVFAYEKSARAHSRYCMGSGVEDL
jgi:hypothetical protein